MMNQASGSIHSASLYVGELHPDVAESALFEMFNRVGPVASIRVCRDSMTRRSLGYAYVNFHNGADAERALDTMNFTEVNGKPCRIMWSQRDPSLRKNGNGNIFIRNLAPSVDNKGLYDTFSVFGNILSCKVATDENGESKGYGYVHFDSDEAAIDAIQKLDGVLIEDAEVKVQHFVRKQDRASQNVWTNVYVKQFPASWDEAKLREIFAPAGETLSVFISRDAEGKSRAFGFVNMANHEAAAKAVAELHNKIFEEAGASYTIYVGRAQKKAERQRELRSKQDQFAQERITKSQGKNLYVKNIADNVTDDQFKEAFSSFGKITSAKIMRDKSDTQVSRGFGFVCYETQEEASKAAADMNGKVLNGKPLFVTFYQKKDQRARNPFPANFNYRMNGPAGMPFMNMYGGNQQGFGNPAVAAGRGAPYPGYAAGGRGQQGGAPRGQGFAGRGNYGGAFPPSYGGQPLPPNFNKSRGAGPNAFPMQPPSGYSAAAAGGGLPRRPMPNANQMGLPCPMGAPQNGRPGPQFAPQGMVPNQFPLLMPGYPQGAIPRGQPAGVKFTNQARNQGGAAPVPVAPVSVAPQQKIGDFSEALLATTDPVLQKNMIGEKLYPLIASRESALAGKITGMLLEMDNGELLNLIESPEALNSKIDEALQVLSNHNKSS